MTKTARKFYRFLGGAALAALLPLVGLATASAATGDLLATVTLLPNASFVGGTAVPTGGGILYVAPESTNNILRVYTPPPGDGVATLEAIKTLVDGGGASVNVSCIAWDSKRQVMLGALTGVPGPVYSIVMGDFFTSSNAVATLLFNSNVGGISLCDGIAYDAGADTVWISPDVNLSVFEFALPGGALLSTVSPENAAGTQDGSVSGVVVGSANSLYIGRNGNNEIRRVDKTTGAFISTFATTAGRVEDLTCDPVTYAPLEAVLAKDAFAGLYEAFEVEEGTCPLPGVFSKDVTSGPDADGNGEIDIAVLVGQEVTTPYDFTITYSNPGGPPVIIIDTVPAEWDVTFIENDNIGNGPDDLPVSPRELANINDGEGGSVDVFKTGRGLSSKSATRLEWTPDPNAGSSDIKVDVTTRGGKATNNKNRGPLFSPTSCGKLTLNDGAVAFELDEFGEILLDPPVTGDPVIVQINDEDAVTVGIMLVAVEDLNGGGLVGDGSGDEDGDGLTDADEAFNVGTDPCNPDTDGGGENDGSEVDNGRDPLDPNDDV